MPALIVRQRTPAHSHARTGLATLCLFAFLLAAALLVPVSKAQAMKIQEVKSPGGISAWLVEEHSVPLLAMRFAFEGGNAQDPPGKEGIANFLAGMLDEGNLYWPVRELVGHDLPECLMCVYADPTGAIKQAVVAALATRTLN